jgi:transcriptional regulator with XRE-family HTH domain
MNFGVRLKELRLEMRLTRSELANGLGISYHSIAKYETSNRFPDIEGLKRIADFLMYLLIIFYVEVILGI